MAARAPASREEKELSRRAATPRGINESNKFRGLLKLKFDLRPTGDYARNCLVDQHERISESRGIRSLSARKVVVASSRIDISPFSNNTVATILVTFYPQRFRPYDDPKRILACRLLEERDGDKPEVFRNSAGSNQTCKRRRLANEERRSALFTRDWLNLLRRISFASRWIVTVDGIIIWQLRNRRTPNVQSRPKKESGPGGLSAKSFKSFDCVFDQNKLLAR